MNWCVNCTWYLEENNKRYCYCNFPDEALVLDPVTGNLDWHYEFLPECKDCRKETGPCGVEGKNFMSDKEWKDRYLPKKKKWWQ